MNPAPARSYTRLAVAIVVAAVVISAALFASSAVQRTVTKTADEVGTTTLTNTSTVTSTTTTTVTSIATTTVTDAVSSAPTNLTLTSSGLELDVGLNATVVASGEAVAAQLTIFNSLDQNLSLIPNYPVNSTISSWDNYDFFCGEPIFSAMIGYALFQGSYSAGNASMAGSPLQLSPPVNIGCVTYSNPDSIVFLPNSDTAVIYSSYSPDGSTEHIAVGASTESCQTNSAGAYLCGLDRGLSGYWNTTAPITEQQAAIGSPFFRYLSPGQYTLEVQDMWNQTVYAHFRVVPASSTTVTTTTSTGCSITGQPGPVFVRVLWDSNQTPVAGALVKATDEPAYCGSTPANGQVTASFTTTSGTQWYSLSSENNAGYSFVVTYLGQTYTFTASLRPLSATCATLYVPSGRTSVSILGLQSSCTSATTTSTSSSEQQSGSLTWYATYGVWTYSVTLSTDTIQPGQNITAVFQLMNTSNQTQTVDAGVPLVNPAIYSQNGTVVWAWDPPQMQGIENVTAGHISTQTLTLPTWNLASGQSYVLSSYPAISSTSSSVDIGAHLQLNETLRY
jgi:hypothetical protein